MKFTAKVKQEARADLMTLVKQGWEPAPATWKLIDWLSAQIAKAEKSGESATEEESGG